MNSASKNQLKSKCYPQYNSYNMFKFVISFMVLGVAMVYADQYLAAPGIITRVASPYIATYPAVPLALANPYVPKLAVPVSSSSSQYSSVATPDSYSEQYREQHKPLAYSAVIY